MFVYELSGSGFESSWSHLSVSGLACILCYAVNADIVSSRPIF